MGSIDELTCSKPSSTDTPSNILMAPTVTIIAKRISCPNPRTFGDKRKASSYHVEARWYEAHANDPALSPICCRGLLSHPQNLDDENDCGIITILMTPLPRPTLHTMRGQVAAAAVRSVARLHARYWGRFSADEAVCRGLAQQGTYWYLDTRPDELDAMSNMGLDGRLKRAAKTIDFALKEHQYQTIVHGDLKACNMSLAEDDSYVTLVDFQYCGKACPAKDLAYLFVCGMDIDDDFEERQEEEFLRLYIKELQRNGVGKSGGDRDAPLPTLEVLTDALDLAYCDLYRWMCGWGVWGNGFLHERVERCLAEKAKLFEKS